MVQKIYVDATPNEIASVLDKRTDAFKLLPKNLDGQMTMLVEYLRIKYGITVTRMAGILNENYANNNTFYITRVKRAGEGLNSSFTASQYLRFMLMFGLSFDDMYEMLCSQLEKGEETPSLIFNPDEIKAFAGCSDETKKKLFEVIAQNESGEAKEAAERALK